MGAGKRRWVPALAFGLVVTAWGLNYLFVRAGLELAAPLWLAFLRSGVGALGFAPFLLWPGDERRLAPREAGLALLLGLVNTSLFFGLWFLAAPSIPPGETAVIVYTFPLWVTMLSVPVLGHRVGRWTGGAMAAGFLGVILVSEPWAGAGASLAPVPVAMLLLGSVSWAVGTVLIQRRFAGPALLTVNAYQLLGGAVGLLAAAVVVEPSSLPPASPSLLWIVLWLGLVGTAFAYGIWFWLLASVPAPRLSSYAFLVPVVALLASAVLLGERLDVLQGIGVALVLAAIYLVGQPAQRREETPRRLPAGAARSR
jgi:drug/metabolite transporter (DMT)-like permease